MSKKYSPSAFARLFRRLSDRSRRPMVSGGHLETLKARIVLAAPTTSLVKDLNTLPSDINANIEEMVQVGSVTYFMTETLIEGKGLWKSDGTTAGTEFIKAVDANNLVNLNGMLCFQGYDTIRGSELWKSDGTSAGTTVLADLVAGEEGSFPGKLTVLGSTLFFTASTPSFGEELWKSNGTAPGTVLVKDILPGTDSSKVEHITAVGSVVYFSATNGTSGNELWKSNGTAAGTVQVREIQPGPYGSYPERLGNAGGVLFFGAYDSTREYAIWKSDGTAAGTIAVKSNLLSSNSVQDATAVGTTLYFTFDDGTHGEELWKSNGTVAGTVMIKDLNGTYESSYPRSLTNIGGVLCFGATANNARTRELWKSNGTAAGTVLVHSSSSEEWVEAARYITNVNGTIFFYAPITNDNDFELWKTDGTTGGGASADGTDWYFKAGTDNVADLAGGELFDELLDVLWCALRLADARMDDVEQVETWSTVVSKLAQIYYSVRLSVAVGGQLVQRTAGDDASELSCEIDIRTDDSLYFIVGCLYVSSTESAALWA